MKKMTIHDHINVAAERLRQAHQRAEARSGPAAACDVFGLSGLGPFALAWVVVRSHPQHPDYCFVVPIDDYPQVGPPDVALDDGRLARCGEGAWVPVAFLRDRDREDVLPEAELGRIRAGVAALFRGQLPDDPEARAVEDDPNYRRWMRQIARARLRLQKLADEAGLIVVFRDLQPVSPGPQLALAAKNGDDLAGVLNEAIRRADRSLHTGRLPWDGPGDLTVTANDHGVMLTWAEEEATRPLLRVPGGQPVTWSGKSTPLLPWLNGELKLEIGDPPTKVTLIR